MAETGAHNCCTIEGYGRTEQSRMGSRGRWVLVTSHFWLEIPPVELGAAEWRPPNLSTKRCPTMRDISDEVCLLGNAVLPRPRIVKAVPPDGTGSHTKS